MHQFGLSAAVVVSLAVPAWALQPPTARPDALPMPAGYPTTGSPPAGYPYPPDINLSGDGLRPDMLPPAVPPPGDPRGPFPVAPPIGPPSVYDNGGYPFDPSFAYQRRRTPPLVHAESWARGDWLYWNFRDAPVPPLIVTGNPNAPGAGIPGGGNLTPLVGPSRDLGQFHGARVTLGQWFDPDGELGLEVIGFIFGREGTADFFQGSPTQPLSVPVLSSTGRPAAYDFSFPNRFTGSLGIRTASQLFGGEGSLLHRWYGDGCFSVDTSFGYRYLWLNERLELYGRSQSAGAIATFAGQTLPSGAIVMTTDSFRAKTEFHGIQLGMRAETRCDMFTLTAYGKGGAGINLQTLRAEGNTVATSSGITRTQVGGLRALPSNFGRDTNSDFSMISETGIELGLQATKNLSIRVGYNLLFWSDVLRPANVMSPIVTLSQVPIDPTFSPTPVPNARPVTVFRSSDFLAHGLVVGMVIDW